MGAKRNKYDNEFKLSTVKLVLEGQKSIRSIAEDLGVNPNSIQNWKRAYQSGKLEGSPQKAHTKPEEEELRKLRKELATVKMERDILKKAVGYFAKDE